MKDKNLARFLFRSAAGYLSPRGAQFRLEWPFMVVPGVHRAERSPHRIRCGASRG
jgi:hypothetical protein